MTSDQATQTLDEADTVLLEGRLSQAEQMFTHVLASQPDNARAHAGYGLARLRQGDAVEALGSFEQAKKLSPGNPNYAFMYANTLAVLDRKDEAISAFDQLLVRDPTQASAAIALIDLLVESGRKAEAQDVARQASISSPSRYPLLVRCGQVLHDGDALSDALVCFDRARSLRPYEPEALEGLIATLRGLGRSKEAAGLMQPLKELRRRMRELEEMRRIASVSTDDPQPSVAYIDRLFFEGWLAPGVEQTSIFLNQFPTADEGGALAVQAARASLMLGEIETADRLIQTAMQRGERTDEEMVVLALVLNGLGRFGAALPILEARIGKNPDDVVALGGLSRVLVAGDDLERAGSVIAKALELEPGHADALAARGLLLLKQLDMDGAQTAFSAARHSQPSHPDALFGLGLLAHQNGDLEEAERYLKEARDNRPGDQSIRAVLALVLSENGRCDEAIPLFNKALEVNQTDMTLHAGVIRCYEETGRTGEAASARRLAEELLGETP